MFDSLVSGLSLVDATGHAILAITLACLLLAVGLNVFLRGSYDALARDPTENGPAERPFSHGVLNCIVRDVRQAVRQSSPLNVQAIVDDNVQSELKTMLTAERFVRAATGLVIILGLLGTFYGLTLSIGRLVHLVSADNGSVTDATQTITSGLTRALAGMAVAFSNSLLGIASAVILTVLGVFSNVTDRRVAWMARVENFVELTWSSPKNSDAAPDFGRSTAAFGESVARLDGAIARFDDVLRHFLAETGELREFNVRLVASGPRTEK
jgi:hypothetical protein